MINNPDNNSFIFFGCWNNGNCKIDEESKEVINSNPLSNVVTKINSFIDENPDNQKPGFLIVAGDNYYPEKVKEEGEVKEKKDKGEKGEKGKGKEKKVKKKIFNSINIQSGFDCLDKIEIDQKYILLGNHDVEKSVKKENHEDRSCKALEFQKERFFKDTKLIDTKNIFFNFYNNSKLLYKIIGDHTIILMFDSTIYDLPDNDTEYLDCYNLLTNNNFVSINSIREFQLRQLNNTINFIKKKIYIKNIIFACHHPIIEIKVKNEILKANALKGLGEFLFHLHEDKGINKRNMKYFHLCADTHLYQKSIVKIEKGDKMMKITQYVVGTGGADQDECKDPRCNNEVCDTDTTVYNSTDIDNFSYNVCETIKDYGFLYCTFDNNGTFTPEFVGVKKKEGESSIENSVKPKDNEEPLVDKEKTLSLSEIKLVVGGKKTKKKIYRLNYRKTKTNKSKSKSNKSK